MKALADEMAFAGRKLEDEELVSYIKWRAQPWQLLLGCERGIKPLVAPQDGVAFLAVELADHTRGVALVAPTTTTSSLAMARSKTAITFMGIAPVSTSAFGHHVDGG